MSYSILLALHISAAFGLFGVFGASLITILKNYTSVFKKLLSSIIALNVFQIVSGFLLFFGNENDMSGKAFCLGLGSYLVVSLVVGKMLVSRIRMFEKQ